MNKQKVFHKVSLAGVCFGCERSGQPSRDFRGEWDDLPATVPRFPRWNDEPAGNAYSTGFTGFSVLLDHLMCQDCQNNLSMSLWDWTGIERRPGVTT